MELAQCVLPPHVNTKLPLCLCPPGLETGSCWSMTPMKTGGRLVGAGGTPERGWGKGHQVGYRDEGREGSEISQVLEV